jgi:predicted outer membrane protein
MTMTRKYSYAAVSIALILLTGPASAADQGDLDRAISAATDAKYKMALAAACAVPITDSPNPRLERFAAALEIGQKELKEKLSQQEFDGVMQAVSAADIGKRVSDGAASGACKDPRNIEGWDFLRKAAKLVK